MPKEVRVPNIYKKTLETTEWSGLGICGLLIGRVLNEKLYISNLWKSPANSQNEFLEEFQHCQLHLPGGTGVVGIIIVTNTSVPEDVQKELQSVPVEIQNASSNTPFVICILQPATGKYVASFHLLRNEGKIFPLREESADDSLDKELVTFRIKAQIPLQLYVDKGKPSNTETWANKVKKAICSVDEAVSCGRFSYGISQTSIFLKENSMVSTDVLHTCQDLHDYFSQNENASRNRRKRAAVDQKPPILIDMYQLITGMDDCFSSPSCAPAVHHKKGSFRAIDVSLPLDVLVEVHEEEALRSLFEIFTNAVRTQLQAMEKSLLQNSEENEFHIPEPFHFLIPRCHACVTVIYPRGIPENELESQRHVLHQQMCLAMDQPLFRRANARIFPGQTAAGGYIINPHIGLPPSGVKCGVPHLVKGNYTYHHYMQDRFDDDKWGCAYRSLQTLVSWFCYQGYTDNPIPTHKEIQQALVDIGDKEENFVGSKKWIGSFEVSYYLEHALGVTSKFINVSSGSELGSKGRELAQHFDTQGTPIMIGGGVLAHTILGVDYSETTGDIKYLILDPHYTGGEDLETIQREGWCGWKTPDFWKSSAHYNLCMPQRPLVF